MVSSSVEPLQNRTGRLTMVFLIVVGLGVAVFNGIFDDSGSADGAPMVGKPAPEVVADLFSGDQWRLSEHMRSDGRPVLLNLWGSWCLPCREEMPELSRFAENNPDIFVIGVAVRDDPKAARKFADSIGAEYPLGVDATGRLRDRYIGFGMPALFLINGTGTVVGQLEGGADLHDIEVFVARSMPEG